MSKSEAGSRGLLVVVPNFGFTPGRWMGPNFLLSMLSTPPFDGGLEVHVVSRGDRDEYVREGPVHLYKVASRSLAVEPFDRYGLAWSGRFRPSPVRELWHRLRDSMRVAALVAGLLPRTKAALWWTEPYPPFGNAVRAYGSLRALRSVFTLANYQRSYPLHDVLLRASLTGVERIVSPCRALTERLAGIGVPRGRLSTIPLGVDMERFRPVSPEEKARLRRLYGIEEGAVVVTWFGPIIPPARPEDVRFLLSLVPAVRARAPDTVFLFAFKYGVPPGLGAGEPGVRFLDGYRDIRDVFHLADIAALPFTDADPWVTVPLSLVEAMACGLPVVTLNRPGLNETIADGESGLLLDRLGQFAPVLARLCCGEEERAALAEGARRRVGRHFDIHAAARSYADILLGEQGP